ncbi:MAG: hypothetical protein GXY42_05665 [Desulfovibrionales bacterium]|nr:hypothetical protein [Desulfovibrionales bacterium]
MDILRNFILALDPFIIWAFRLVDDPWVGFFLGISVLNLICVIMGDVTSQLARRLNRNLYGRYRDEMVRHHNLSVRALRHADKEAYKAVNKQAHEAFGKYFFSQAGAFTLSIWPVPFAMAWMELRFGGIPLALPFSLPGVGQSVAYPFFFIPVYIAARILYGKAMRCFPFYQRILAWTRHGDGTEMVPFVDLLKPSPDQDASESTQDAPPPDTTEDKGQP